MKTRQELFSEWLSEQVHPGRLAEYYLALADIEILAHKKNLFKGSIFDVTDPAISRRLLNDVTEDRIFRYEHRKNNKIINDAAKLFHQYTTQALRAGRSEGLRTTPNGPAKEEWILAQLRNHRLSFRDNRKSNGCLWIVGGHEMDGFIADCTTRGYTFHFKPDGCNAFPNKQVWWTRDTPTPQEQITIDFPPKAGEGETPAVTGSVLPEKPKDPPPSELAALLPEEEMKLLVTKLEEQGIRSPQQLAQINIWAFLNRFNLYGLKKRQEIFHKARAKLQTTIAETNQANGAKSETRSGSKTVVAPPPSPAPEPKTRSDPGTKEEKAALERLIAKAERIVLKADLAGITPRLLSAKLGLPIYQAEKLAAESKHIVKLGEKLVHDGAFVDWEEGADQLASILDKLLDRNNGYVTAGQLYEFAHLEMAMFLNDNDIDDEGLVLDLAKHLFKKIGYGGKHLAFQANSHISRSDAPIANVPDLIRHYAISQGGAFREEDLIQYLKSVGREGSNHRQAMKLYTQPFYLLYDKEWILMTESLNMDAAWFTTANKALDALFDDMGDHIVLRDIQPWWFSRLPTLPGGRPWTLLLFQSILFHFSQELGGAHTIKAVETQAHETIHAMLVTRDSEIQTFPDAVTAFLIDDGIEQREFEAEKLRALLVRRGLIAGNELIWNMPKALAGDTRYAWSADGQHVTVKV